MSTQGRFTKMDKLGEGTYGVVYKAQDKGNGNIVALKRMNIAQEEDGVPATTIREVAILKEMQHENIVRLYDVLFQMPKLTLVFEFVEFDLKKYMDHRGGSLDPEREIKSFMKQMLDGLAYMHARSVVHRDMKPQNLLITSDLKLKLADFGLARVEGIPVKKYSHEAVTLWYRSPDVILGSSNYGLAVDIWSVGCIFAEMILGQPLCAGKSDPDQLLRIFKLLGTPTKELWPSMHLYPGAKTTFEKPGFEVNYTPGIEELLKRPEFKRVGEAGIDLLRRMLRYEPAHRITVHEALKHAYFTHK
eukprot:PhM_4_TR8170/c0_g1_i1/m.62764